MLCAECKMLSETDSVFEYQVSSQQKNQVGKS
jgi:hypothetical protein